MRTKFGTAFMIASIVALGLLVISEVQYWTLQAFQDTIKDPRGFGTGTITVTDNFYDPPALTLNIGGSAYYGLTIFAVVTSALALMLLAGKWRLLGLASLWFALGATFRGHLTEPAASGWLVLAILAMIAAVGPDVLKEMGNKLGMYKKTAVTAGASGLEPVPREAETS